MSETTIVSLMDARARLGQLADRAVLGETIIITRRGFHYVRLVDDRHRIEDDVENCVGLTKARARLGQLADRAVLGETILITKQGFPYVRLDPIASPDMVVMNEPQQDDT